MKMDERLQRKIAEMERKIATLDRIVTALIVISIGQSLALAAIFVQMFVR